MPPEADIRRRIQHVCFVPLADIQSPWPRRNIFLRQLFFVPLCPKRHSFLGEGTLQPCLEKAGKHKGRGISMRVFIACAIILTAAIGLGGCWGHHEKAVVAEPLKLG